MGRLFGTDGARGIANKELNCELAMNIGRAAAYVLTEKTTDEHFVGDNVGLFIEPDAIHIMKKSKYSGLYGDYSSYSEEIDHLSDVIEEE